MTRLKCLFSCWSCSCTLTNKLFARSICRQVVTAINWWTGEHTAQHDTERVQNKWNEDEALVSATHYSCFHSRSALESDTQWSRSTAASKVPPSAASATLLLLIHSTRADQGWCTAAPVRFSILDSALAAFKYKDLVVCTWPADILPPSSLFLL